MASAATAAIGTVITINTVPIAELKALKPAGITSDLLDVTNHDSTGGFKEYIIGLSDGGEVTMSGNYLPGSASQAALVAANLNHTTDAYTIVFPDGASTTWSFNGLVRSFEPQSNYDGILSFNATVKITGQPTIV